MKINYIVDCCRLANTVNLYRSSTMNASSFVSELDFVNHALGLESWVSGQIITFCVQTCLLPSSLPSMIVSMQFFFLLLAALLLLTSSPPSPPAAAEPSSSESPKTSFITFRRWRRDETVSSDIGSERVGRCVPKEQADNFVAQTFLCGNQFGCEAVDNYGGGGRKSMYRSKVPRGQTVVSHVCILSLSLDTAAS